MLMALIQEETVSHAQLRAMAQLLIDKEQGMQAFEEYMKVAFPYLETQRKRDSEEMLTRLKEWVDRGPIGIEVKPELKPTRPSRKPPPQPAKGRSPSELSHLYSKLRRV